MAKFILGGIVTNIAGSVGGTTLRRVKNGFSMYNKIKGTSVSKLLQNQRIPQIANIFQRWGLLSDEDRAGWNAQAALITFPDKFGTAKNLTGRQLFSKANIQLLPVGESIASPTGFTADTPAFTLISAVANATDSEYELGFNGISAAVRIMVSVQVSNKQIYQPTFKSRKVIDNFFATAPSFDALIASAVTENFPYLQAGMWVCFYVQAINSYGMVSPYQYIILQTV